MRRRELVALLAGAAATWPLATRAQQRTRPVIGFLHIGSSAQYAPFLESFRGGLREAGYVEGQNVAFEFRFAGDQRDRLPGLADELIQRQVSVIVTATPAIEAIMAKTTAIPIVFLSGPDPVTAGYVQSLNRPGGNLTGVSLISPNLATKRIGILHDLVPHAGSIAILWNPGTVPPRVRQLREEQVRDTQVAASTLGLSNIVVAAGSEPELDQAFETLARARPGALIVSADVFFLSQRARVVALAARLGVPSIYELREFVAAGGLVSYGPSTEDGFRQVGLYAGRILDGAKPADLPVVLPSKFHLVINLKTAQALGVQIPPTLLAIADEVIE